MRVLVFSSNIGFVTLDHWCFEHQGSIFAASYNSKNSNLSCFRRLSDESILQMMMKYDFKASFKFRNEKFELEARNRMSNLLSIPAKQRKFHLVKRSCQHYATYIITGKFLSYQIDNRDLVIKNLNEKLQLEDYV